MKSNLDSLFKGNVDAEKEGVWFAIGEETKFLVKRFGGANQVNVQKAMAKYYKPYAKLIDKGLFPEDKEKRIMAKVFVEACLIDWEKVIIDGEEIPYSPAKAVELFESLPDLLITLTEYASNMESFKEDLGNS